MRMWTFLNLLKNKSKTNRNEQKTSPSILYDDIIYPLLPYLNQNEIIRIAGVCSSWRRIVINTSEGSFCNVLYSRNHFKNIRMKMEKMSENHQVFSMFSQFDFSDCNLTSSQFNKIFTSPKLTSLTLSNTNIIIFSPLESSLSQLTFLSIEKIKLSTSNIKQLLQFKNLKKLQLLFTKNNCEHLDIIINNQSLQLETLIIKDKISKEGLSIIFNPKLKSTLNTLYVKNMNTDELISFNIDTDKFPHLRELEIFGNLDKPVLEKIFNYGLELTHLSIYTFRHVLDFSHLHQIPSLKTFYHDAFIDPNTIQQILNLDNMENLIISHLDRVSSLKLCTILSSNFSSLASLELSKCKIEIECGKYIYNLKHLTQLNFRLSKFQSVEIFEFIFKMKTLQHLDLQWCEIGDEGLKYLTNHNLDNLHTLILDRNKFTHVGFQYLTHTKFKHPLTYLSILDHINYKGTVQFDNEHNTLNVKTLFIYDNQIDFRGVISVLQNCIMEELMMEKPLKFFLGSLAITRISQKKQVKLILE